MSTQTYPPPNDFESVLDFCVDEIQAGRLTLGACLTQYPAFAPQLAPLLAVIAMSLTLPQPAMMRAEAREALEQQLRSRVKALPAPRRVSRPARGLSLRWALATLAVVIVVGFTGAGTVAAAAGSLPGDWLYPVKRWSETLALQTASAGNRLQLRVEWAARRLTEFRALAERGIVDVTLLAEMEAETQAALAASQTQDELSRAEALAHIAALHATAIDVVAGVRERAPQAAWDGLDQALTVLATTREDVLNHLPLTPMPTATSTQMPRPTRTPTPTSTRPLDASATATPTPPARGTPGQGLTSTPSGQGTPGGGRSTTPRGQGTPGGGNSSTPPGQSNNPGGGPPDHEPNPPKGKP